MNSSTWWPFVHLLELDDKGTLLVIDNAVGLATVLDAPPLSRQAALADPLPQALFFDTDHSRTVKQ